MPKIEISTIVNVLIALIIFALLDRLFLGEMLEKISANFEKSEE